MATSQQDMNEKMAKMRAARKPYPGHSAETRAKQSAKAQGRQGHAFTEAQRARIAKANTGKVRTEEARAKVSAAKTGVPQSAEANEKRAEALKDWAEYGIMGKELRFITMLATGQSVKAAAQIVGFTPQVAYRYANDLDFRQGILDATALMRVLLYKDMPAMLDTAKKTLMDVMTSPTARNECKVKAAAHTISLAIFLATQDKGFVPPLPSEDDLKAIEGLLLE
jgi:hypothetical protein